jgi:hypothetical protein
MGKFFMLDPKTGKHHKAPRGKIWTHYPNTCNVYDAHLMRTSGLYYSPSSSKLVVRFSDSELGLVGIIHETEGKMVFVVQLPNRRIAWQRLDWQPNYQDSWDEAVIESALRNFLWVAQCEESRKLLPR